MVSKMKKMKQLFPLLAMPAFGYAVFLFDGARAETAEAGNVQISRGKYLVQFGSCTDCHTPGYRLENRSSTSVSRKALTSAYACPALGLLYPRT